MKEIRIFLASAYELEPDRARIGNLIRRLNDEYEKLFIHLRLVKWEDLDSFYNKTEKQSEYDFHIRGCNLFIALFWHRAGRFTVHEVEVARASLDPQDILIFKKDGPIPKDYEGSEDIKRFEERYSKDQEALQISKQSLEQYLETQKPYSTYREFSELEAVLTRKLEEYCGSVVVSEEEKKQTFSGNAIQIHVAASPEIEPDLARLGDLIRCLDENSKHYCRIRMIQELPECDMFVSMCHTSAPEPFQDEIARAIETRNQSGLDKPYLYFCIKYLEAGSQKEQSMIELERRFKENLAHFPDRYAQAPEMKLHFILQLERLKRNSSSDAMLIVKNGILYQKLGDAENPLMSCEDMISLRKDEEYQEMKRQRDELETKMADLKKEDRTSDQDLSQEIRYVYEKLCEIEEQIENRQKGFLRLARLIEEMTGKVQDESILRIRKLIQDGQIERALRLLPKPKDLCQDIEEMLRKHHAELQRYYDVCKLTISCLLASNAVKNRDVVCDLYELLIKLAGDLGNKEKKADDCFEYASFLHDFGKYDKALEYFQMALDIRLGLWGENHPATADVYNKIGSVWMDKGLAKAMEFYQKALEIRLHTLGENHPDVAKSYNNIGNVWDRRGDYDKALEYHSKALGIKRLALGEVHPSVAISLFGCGNVWRSKGDYDKALEFCQKALDILLVTTGENHPAVASCYNNIGSIWLDKGDFDKALVFYGKALDLRIQLFGENHPDVARCYIVFGDIWSEKGDYDKALEFFGKALDLRIQLFGEYHPDVESCLDRIGNVWAKKGDYDKALEYYGKALDIRIRRNRRLGEKHPGLVPDYNRIGNAWFSKGDYDKALEFFGKALDILLQTPDQSFRRLFTKEEASLHTAYSFFMKGNSLEKLGRKEEAAPCFAEARSIAVKYPKWELSRMILEKT